MARVLGTFAQVTLAVTLVACLAVLGLAVFNRDALSRAALSAPARRRVDVFKGMLDLAENTDSTYGASALELPPSMNQPGGLEYAFNFWLYIPAPPTTAPDAEDRAKRSGMTKLDVPLLLRGTPEAVEFKNVCDKANGNGNTKDFLTKAPYVKLTGPNRDVLVVELNTSRSPHAGKGAPRCDGSSNDWGSMNSHRLAVSGLSAKLFENRWTMFTVTVAGANKVTAATEPLPARNHARVQLFVNGRFVAEQKIVDGLDNSPSASLRGNAGPLVVAPVKAYGGAGQHALPVSATDVKSRFHMANLSYFNYAVSEDEARALHAGGFDKTVAKSNNQVNRAKLTTLLDIANDTSVLGSNEKAVTPLV